MKIEEIKEKLESSKSFKYWSEEVGITFDDFEIIDEVSSKVLKHDDTRIGTYYIMILKSGKMGAFYDLTVESMREKQLQKVQENTK